MISVNNITKIQEIRAIHALSELDISIFVNKEDEYKFKRLKDYFKMSFKVLSPDQENLIDYKELVKIDHSKPFTSILLVTKPLIFPRTIPVYLKSKWPKNRNYKFSFCGLLTSKRKKLIQNWMSINCDKHKIEKESFLYKLKKKIYSRINLSSLLIKDYGGLYFWSSQRGRGFPVKSWDNDYYNFLLNSQFVLCPSGDYIWTYRFFEAIMCGAIPVVEETCSSYEGFKFYMMDEDRINMKYTTEDTEYNFKLLLERITFNDEDSELIKHRIKQLTANDY